MKPRLAVDNARADFDKNRYQPGEQQASRGVAGGGDGGHIGGMTTEDRVTKLELATAKVDGQLDFAKIVLATLLAAVLGGFGLLLSVTLNGNSRIESKVEGITSKINDEFRSQRADQSETVSAISNAITAAKQQAPQVLLVPAPAAPIAPPNITVAVSL